MIVLDVGNTAVTAALSTSDGMTRLASLRHSEPGFAADLEAWLREAPSSAPIAVASVNDAATRLVLAAVPRARRVLLAPRDFAPSVENRCDPPDKVGLDRLFNAEACDPAKDHVVIDAGTAITVDRVDRGGIFRGGAIAPGLRISFEALHRETGRLPRVAPEERPPALGTSTDAAIRSGVQVGLAGAIDRLASELATPAADVVLTGGDAPLFLPLLRTAVRQDLTLTLRGIAAAASRSIGASG